MKGSSNIISAIQSLKASKEYFDDFIREHKDSNGARMFKEFTKRIDWMANQLITHPFLPESVRVGIRKEWNSDVFAVPAITEKIAMLTPEQRNAVECVIEECLKGQSLTIEYAEE